MRKTKKLFSMLLALSVLCGSITFTAAAQETDVVFELDMSSLTDKSGNNIEAVQLGTVAKNSFTNQAGAKVNYITTGSGSGNLRGSDESGVINISDEAITKLDNYTVEAWLKYETPSATDIWPKFFSSRTLTENRCSPMRCPTVQTERKWYT